MLKKVKQDKRSMISIGLKVHFELNTRIDIDKSHMKSNKTKSALLVSRKTAQEKQYMLA